MPRARRRTALTVVFRAKVKSGFMIQAAFGWPEVGRSLCVSNSQFTADAAYDTVAVYETAGARAAAVVIPPARTANVSGHGPRSPARDRTITLVKQLGRRRWKKASGYHRQGRVENTFFRYKSIIGDGLRARSPAGQGSEVVLGCEILNRMTPPGYFVHPRRMRPAYAALR